MFELQIRRKGIDNQMGTRTTNYKHEGKEFWWQNRIIAFGYNKFYDFHMLDDTNIPSHLRTSALDVREYKIIINQHEGYAGLIGQRMNRNTTTERLF